MASSKSTIVHWVSMSSRRLVISRHRRNASTGFIYMSPKLMTISSGLMAEENRWGEVVANSAGIRCRARARRGHDRLFEPILRRIVDRVALAQPDNRDREIT